MRKKSTAEGHSLSGEPDKVVSLSCNCLLDLSSNLSIVSIWEGPDSRDRLILLILISLAFAQLHIKESNETRPLPKILHCEEVRRV